MSFTEDELRNLVGWLWAADTVTDSIIAQTTDLPDQASELGDGIAELAAEVHDWIADAEKLLMRCLPGFAEMHAAENAVGLERGRIWSEQRREKIALLRLAGDDAPEDQIP